MSRSKLTAKARGRSRSRVLIMLLLALALVASACGDNGEADEPAPPTDPAEENGEEDVDEPEEVEGADNGEDEGDAALEPGSYPVGFQSLTSGPAAFAGVPLAQGARLALEEVNETASLGEGVTLELIEQDAGGDPAQAIAAVQRMFGQDVAGIICCALSSEAGSVKPLLEEERTPGIVSSAILPGLPEPPYMYRPVLLLAEVAYDPLMEAITATGAETVLIGVTGDNDGMVAEGELFTEAAEVHGMEIVGTIDTATGDTDFAGPASEVISVNPDVFVASKLGNEATLMIRALRDRGYEGTIVTTYGVSNENNYAVGGDALAGTILPIAFAVDADIDEAQRFTELYRDAYGADPDVFAAQGYEAMRLLIEGMRRAGSGDPEAVAEALATIDSMETVYGPVVYEDGQARLAGDPIFVEWQEGGTLAVWEP